MHPFVKMTRAMGCWQDLCSVCSVKQTVKYSRMCQQWSLCVHRKHFSKRNARAYRASKITGLCWEIQTIKNKESKILTYNKEN